MLHSHSKNTVYSSTTNRDLNFSGIMLVALLTASGCGYTQLKLAPPSSNREVETRAVDSWQVDLLCRTWKGTIVTKMNGIPISTDSIYSLTIYPDSTWELEDERGLFTGQWSFKDGPTGRPEFSFSMRSNVPDRELDKHFIGYFRDWGLQLYPGHSGPHMIDVEWNLRRYDTVDAY